MAENCWTLEVCYSYWIFFYPLELLVSIFIEKLNKGLIIKIINRFLKPHEDEKNKHKNIGIVASPKEVELTLTLIFRHYKYL